jgi:hypothetical protein
MKKTSLIKLLGKSLLVGGLLFSSLAGQTLAKGPQKITEQAKQQFIKIKNHQLTVPHNWEVMEGLDSYSFLIKGKNIGGLDALNFDPEEQTIENLLPNHSKLLKKETLKGYPFPTIKVELEQSSPAASGKKEAITYIHYYMIDAKSKSAYDLYFIKNKIGYGTISTILKNIS